MPTYKSSFEKITVRTSEIDEKGTHPTVGEIDVEGAILAEGTTGDGETLIKGRGSECNDEGDNEKVGTAVGKHSQQAQKTFPQSTYTVRFSIK